ncbi:MAG: class I SAM-dependent methyltransferase [Actinomycetota bacterium]|nr:class I SAM-dependent methyltransferase [Actinomycetota bacterium]
MTEAQRRGFLGPGPVAAHVEHARAFVEALSDAPPAKALDLGSGAGLPGLPLALAWTGSHWWLLDANGRRGAFLAEVVADLALATRVTVLVGRAEELAHNPQWRGRFELVTARSFGRPAVTSECAAGFLRVGGRLAVSEPPEPADERWPADGLSELGLRPDRVVARSRAGVRVLEQVVACPDRFPRRVGVPAKRPLF